MSARDERPMSSPPVPPLPVTWRPRRTRVVAYAVAAAVLVSVVVVALALPSSGVRPFSVVDRVGMILVGVAIACVLGVMARPRITAEERGLTVVNLVRTHQLEWAQVVDVHLNDGEPWLVLDTSDGETLPAMGVQASGGARARQATAELAALVTAQTRTERND